MSEYYVKNHRGNIYFTPTGKVQIKDEPVTPTEEDFDNKTKKKTRKSLSMNDIAPLPSDLSKLYFTQTGKEEIKDEPMTPTEEDFRDYNNAINLDNRQLRKSLSLNNIVPLPSDLSKLYVTPTGKVEIKDEPMTPTEEDFRDYNNAINLDNRQLRKSISTNNIVTLPSDLSKLYFTPTGKVEIKDEPMTPTEEDFRDKNLDVSINIDNRGLRKSMSLNNISPLASDSKLGHPYEYPDHRHHRVIGTGEPSKNKFVSVAEAVYNYLRGTSNCFPSWRPTAFCSKGATGPSGPTISQSPMLRCKARSRPVPVLSQKEKEEMEAEEVIEGCRNLPVVPRKLPTVPDPFNLDINLPELNKKLDHCPVHVQVFKARPVPKHILENPQKCPKQVIPVIKPVSPTFHYKATTQVQKPVRHGPILTEPFSFEKRDEEIKRRREEKMKRQVEEERKHVSQFKARPLPGAVKKRMQVTAVKCGSSSTSSENKENQVKFEAKPPVVLYKEPFKPVLQEVQLVKPTPFQLNTEKRAADREKFTKILKQKEEERERLRQQREKEMLVAEEKANTEMRARLVHHPKPVPAPHQPFVPEKSDAPLTVPETPKFIRRLKQNSN